MPRRISWPKVKKFWWCFNCNIPTLQSTCPRCGEKTKRLPLSDPGDARPAFERDYKFLHQAYVYEFGTSKGFSDVIGKSTALLNKAPYYDEMKEVIVDGVHIGRLYFDPLLRKWRFRLSRYTALKLYTSHPDILEVAVINKKKGMYGDIIRVDKDVEQGRQVVLIDKSKNVVGIGYSKGRGRIMIHSLWEPQQKASNIDAQDSYRRSDLNDVINAHRDYIRIISAQAKKFVAIMYSRIRRPVIASFSGGKDSLVSLHLVLDLGVDPVVLFNNTGIELPETIATVYKVVDRYGLKLVEASADNKFWSAVYELGIPGRDYRWCCKVCKLAPLALTVKQMWGSSGGLNIVGQRAFESIDRARSPRVWRLRWAPMLLNLSPINEWSQFEVWLYIFAHNLDVNPLYFMGYERIGCFMCPASTMAELDLVSQTHKDLWSRWLDVLEYWAKRLDLPREWIDYALWRWNAPARYRTMIAKRLGVRERVDDWAKTFKSMASPAIVDIERGEGVARVLLEKDIDVECIANQITVLNPVNFEVDSDRGYAEIRWEEATVLVNGRSLEARYTSMEGVEKIIDILKVYYRWLLCTGCRSCEAICPSGATQIKVFGGRHRPTVDKSKCTSCKFCVYNCPVAEVYVEHVITPIIFSDPEAWRRETREHHDEVLEKIRSFVKSTIPITKPEPTSEEPSLDISYFFNMGSS